MAGVAGWRPGVALTWYKVWWAMLDAKVDLNINRVLRWFVVECCRTICSGCCDGTLRLSKEGEKDKNKNRVLLEGGRESGKMHLHVARPAIGSLPMFRCHHAHASRHLVKCIAVFGSFVKQHRGVLANRKRGCLGRQAASGRQSRRHDCNSSSLLTLAAEHSQYSST